MQLSGIHHGPSYLKMRRIQMNNASKSKASLWFGHLSAGARSSPVLRDARLDTGNPKTLYMFNLKRGEILEYAREVPLNRSCVNSNRLNPNSLGNSMLDIRKHAAISMATLPVSVT